MEHRETICTTCGKVAVRGMIFRARGNWIYCRSCKGWALAEEIVIITERAEPLWQEV